MYKNSYLFSKTNPSKHNSNFKLMNFQGEIMSDGDSAETSNSYFANVVSRLSEQIVKNQNVHIGL